MCIRDRIFLLLFGGMPLFDSITLSLGTAGTGGFGIKNDSIAGYSTYCQVIITIFMIPVSYTHLSQNSSQIKS